MSSIYDPGNALHGAYLMKLCFPFIDLSGVSSERLGDVVETVFGLCFLATRFPRFFEEKLLGRNFVGLNKLHAVLSMSIQIFVVSLSDQRCVSEHEAIKSPRYPIWGGSLHAE